MKPRADTKPGDMFVFNDPYVAGGMHLPDVYIVKPMFVDGSLEGYAATLVHQTDMGGLAPGSTAVFAQEIFQEGLRIPILNLYEEGRRNETFFKIMALNNRLPDNGRRRHGLADRRMHERGPRFRKPAEALRGRDLQGFCRGHARPRRSHDAR